MIEVKFKKLSDKAVIPAKAHLGDIGFDMVATSIEKTEQYISYKTDIALDLPEGYCAFLFPRSSVSKYDLSLSNSIGLVDQSFKGNLEFRYRRIINANKLTLRSRFKNLFCKIFGIITDIDVETEYGIYDVGDKIGQIVIMPYPEVTFTEVDHLSESDRGADGFGSTDTVKKPKKPKSKRN